MSGAGMSLAMQFAVNIAQDTLTATRCGLLIWDNATPMT